MSEEIKAARNAIIAAGIKAEKSKFVPLIEAHIIETSKGEGLGFIRCDAQENLFRPAMSFRMHLKGNNLRRFNEAWEQFYGTTRYNKSKMKK